MLTNSLQLIFFRQILFENTQENMPKYLLYRNHVRMFTLMSELGN